MKNVKKIILGGLFGLIMIPMVNAQDISPSKVPSVVINKMRHDFPQAKSVEWEMKGENYEVEFEISKKDYEILYSPTGEVLYQKEELSVNELPKNITEKIKIDYPGYRVSDVKKIQNRGEVNYSFEVESAREELEIKMDEAGNLISKKID